MATVYVSPTGSDSNTYAQAQSRATPWLTIGKCNTSATTGDTIVCLSGTHTWATVAFTKSFTIQADVNPTGGVSVAATWNTIFDGAGAGVIWRISGQTLSITGIEFKNQISADNSEVFGTNANSCTLTATNCKFTDIQTSAGNFGGASSALFFCNTNTGGILFNLTCQNCTFQNVRRASGSLGILNTIFGSRSASNAHSVTFTNCVFYLPEATYPLQALFNVAASNTITLAFKNNIVHTNSAVRWIVTSGAAFYASSVTYSDLYNMASSPTLGTGAITSDPLFVDATVGNYNLRPTSPCIATGTMI